MKEIPEYVPHTEIEDYGDPNITSMDVKVPRWLKLVYITLPLWGILCFYLYGNGVTGWLSRGDWYLLQKAANTTFPRKNNDKSAEADHKDQESGVSALTSRSHH